MKRIDLGERLTVKVESYSYGADELFYTNAVTGGVTVFIEDGVEDGDETVDSYVIPTWGVESVQDVLTRYFRVTISWLTDAATDGAVHYGTTAALGGIVLDERGTPVSARTHQVTLVNLAPQTTYSFYAISSDALDDHGGAYYQFTTGPAFAPNPSDLAFGQVLRSDGTTPAAGALVRAKLRDADTPGSTGDSAPLSALVNSSGYWSFDLAATRITDYAQLFDYSLVGDRLVLEVTDGMGCTASQIVDTGLDAPAPDMILVCPTQATHAIASGWTLLGLSVQSDPAPTAEATLDDIVAQGGNTIEIERWWNGGWDAHVRDLPFNNFTLALGRDYFVRASSASAWTRTGLPPVAPLPLNLYPGWNLVGLPKLTGSLLAEDLLAGIAAQGGACSEVDRWVSGGWVGQFLVHPGRGEFVRYAYNHDAGVRAERETERVRESFVRADHDLSVSLSVGEDIAIAMTTQADGAYIFGLIARFTQHLGCRPRQIFVHQEAPDHATSLISSSASDRAA